MTKCESCKAKYEKAASAQSRKSTVIIIALIIALVVMNIAWIVAWCQYDYVSYEITSDDGNANYIGGDGDIMDSAGGDITNGNDQDQEAD